jgi:hypothetical protein
MQNNDDESGAFGCAAIVVTVLFIIAFIWLAIHHWRW